MRKLLFAAIAFYSLSLVQCGKEEEKEIVNRFVIYYVTWNMDTFARYSCSDVLQSEDSVSVSKEADVKRLKQLLEIAKKRTISEYPEVDARICLVTRDTSGAAVDEITFSQTSLMKIDGMVYDTDSSLFNFVLKYLPPNYLQF